MKYQRCKICSKKKLLKINNSWVMCNNCNYIFDTNPTNNFNDLKENKLYRPQTDFINDNKFKNKLKDLSKSLSYFNDFDSKHNLKLLDFGSSAGYMHEVLKDKNIDVFGVEISNKYRNYANTNNRITYETINELKKYHEKESFDIIYMRNSFHFVDDIPNLMREFDSLLKKDGKIIFYEPSIDFSRDVLSSLLYRHITNHHKHWLSFFSIDKIFRHFNYKVDKKFFRPNKLIFSIKKDHFTRNTNFLFHKSIYMYLNYLYFKTIIKII